MSCRLAPPFPAATIEGVILNIAVKTAFCMVARTSVPMNNGWTSKELLGAEFAGVETHESNACIDRLGLTFAPDSLPFVSRKLDNRET
jgi:hypothetical protein